MERENRQPARPKSVPLGSLSSANRMPATTNNNQEPAAATTNGQHQPLTPGSSVAITLRKGERGFGFSIRGGEGMPLFVLRIADGGAASQDLSLIHI